MQQTKQNKTMAHSFWHTKHEYEMHKLTEDYMIVSPWFEICSIKDEYLCSLKHKFILILRNLDDNMN